MGRAQKLKQQRREEERLKQLEKYAKRKRTLLWSMGLTLAACVIALVLVVVLVQLPTYVKQMVIETERGNIVVEMKDADAPLTSAHMEKLVEQGSYKGAKFYQVDEIAAMTGTEGRDAAAAENVETVNRRGAVGMAKPSDPQTQQPLPDSATNEFYILKQDAPSLDPNFTIFGHVSEGMDVVDAFTQGTVINSISLDGSGSNMIIEQDAGSIVIALDTEGTPQTVQHVTDLINTGFYAGMNWYRVENFVVQTGSHARSLEQAGADEASIQQGSEQDSSVPTVVDEITYQAPEQDPMMQLEEAATVPSEGKLPAVRGAVVLYWMAQTTEETAGMMPENPTEFLIMKQDYSEQVGTSFTVFGEVIEGMPVVDSLQTGDPIKTIYIREVRKD
jgi:peptidylprolyl isomerase